MDDVSTRMDLLDYEEEQRMGNVIADGIDATLTAVPSLAPLPPVIRDLVQDVSTALARQRASEHTAKLNEADGDRDSAQQAMKAELVLKTLRRDKPEEREAALKVIATAYPPTMSYIYTSYDKETETIDRIHSILRSEELASEVALLGLEPTLEYAQRTQDIFTEIQSRQIADLHVKRSVITLKESSLALHDGLFGAIHLMKVAWRKGDDAVKVSVDNLFKEIDSIMSKARGRETRLEKRKKKEAEAKAATEAEGAQVPTEEPETSSD